MFNKDKMLLVLEVENGTVDKIVQVIDTEHLPVVLQDNLTVESLNKWMSKRRIPESREGLASMLNDFPGSSSITVCFPCQTSTGSATGKRKPGKNSTILLTLTRKTLERHFSCRGDLRKDTALRRLRIL